MDRIEKTDESAFGGGWGAAANLTHSLQPGRFGDRWVSEVPGASGPYFRLGPETGGGVVCAEGHRGNYSRMAADVPSPSGLSGTTTLQRLQHWPDVLTRPLLPMPPPIPIPSGTQRSVEARVSGGEGAFPPPMLPQNPATSGDQGRIEAMVFGNEGSAANAPAVASGASAAGGVRKQHGALPPAIPPTRCLSQWRAFARWCHSHQMQHWPASAQAVAQYLKDRAESCKPANLTRIRAAISATHLAAKLEDPCASGIVKRALGELARRLPRERAASGPVSSSDCLGADDLEPIREAALRRRRFELTNRWEHPETARKRGLVDIALCSLVVQAGLRCEEAAELMWEDLTVSDGRQAAIRIRDQRGGEGERSVAIPEQTYRDLQAIALDGEPAGSIFGLGARRIRTRIDAAAKAADIGKRVARDPRSLPGDNLARKIPDGYKYQVQAFRRWCDEQGLGYLPADAGTVADFIRHRADQVAMHSVEQMHSAISWVHRRANLANPCDSEPVKAAMRAARAAHGSFVPTMLDADAMTAIRMSALWPRLSAGTWESVHAARQRGLVDIALCSVFHSAKLSTRRLLELEWRNLEQQSEDAATLTVRSGPGPDASIDTLALTGQIVRDLEAIRGDAGPEDAIFDLERREVNRRIDAAAKAAGLDASFPGVQPRTIA